jgi:hypothetical protein
LKVLEVRVYNRKMLGRWGWTLVLTAARYAATDSRFGLSLAHLGQVHKNYHSQDDWQLTRVDGEMKTKQLAVRNRTTEDAARCHAPA